MSEIIKMSRRAVPEEQRPGRRRAAAGLPSSLRQRRDAVAAGEAFLRPQCLSAHRHR